MSSTNLESRLRAISHCSAELAACVKQRGNKENGLEWATLGELDWLHELHILLYEENAYLNTFSNNTVDPAMPGIGGAPTRNTSLPKDDAARKAHPVASGFLDYFPDAIPLVAHLSFTANEKHNPGEPVHWARGKSTDEPDTMMRHFMSRGTFDDDGHLHDVKVVWRALANLQKEIERRKAAGEPICLTKYYKPEREPVQYNCAGKVTKVF